LKGAAWSNLEVFKKNLIASIVIRNFRLQRGFSKFEGKVTKFMGDVKVELRITPPVTSYFPNASA